MRAEGRYYLGAGQIQVVEAAVLAAMEDHPHLARRTAQTAAPPELEGLTASWDYPGVQHGLVVGPPAVYYEYQAADSALMVTVAADTPQSAATVADAVVAACEPLPELTEQLRVRFWTLGEHGPVSRTRLVDSPHWADVALNYGGRAHEQLSEMVDWSEPPGHGQLVVMHGPVGTGKTHAIAALADAWRKWCDMHYVVDPERFFGDAEYMLSVVLNLADGEEGILHSVGEGPEPDVLPPARRWRLLVVEDAAELIRADAREETGQGLSRLLNLCDGFIGQGVRVLVMLTTNEEVGKLHAAITRPGRCAAQLRVDDLGDVEVETWAAARGVDPSDWPSGSLSLARCYALARGEEPETPTRVGFTR